MKLSGTGLVRLLILVVFIVVVATIIHNGNVAEEQTSHLFANNVIAKGKVLAYYKSTNHSFGVVKISVTQSNKQSFYLNTPAGLFPYRIKHRYAEFYGYIPIDIKVGDEAEINSNNKLFKFIRNRKTYAETTLFISNSEINISYVRKHTSFK